MQLLLLFFSSNTSTYNAYSTVFPAAELAARLLPWVFVGVFFLGGGLGGGLLLLLLLLCFVRKERKKRKREKKKKKKTRQKKKEASNDVLPFKAPKVP